MVRRFIASVDPGELFAARQVIHMGPSKSIYNMLSRMVLSGKLIRMTYGVYQKPVRFGITTPPTPEKIAALKLKVFGREAITHACELVAEIDEYQIGESCMEMSGLEKGPDDRPLECTHTEHVTQPIATARTALDTAVKTDSSEGNSVEMTAKRNLIYDIDGSSSVIHTKYGVIKFRRVSKRKMSLGDTKVGRVVRALWECGEDFVSERRIYKALEMLGRAGREELGNTSAMGPNWLRDCIGSWEFIKLNQRTRPVVVT